MGGCAVSTQKPTGTEFKGDTEPEDTNSLKGVNLPERIFNVKLSNIKLKNLPYEAVSLGIQIYNYPEIKFQKRKVQQGVVKWNDKPQKLQLKMNEYELRKEWMTIWLYYSDIKMSEIRLNLFRIASGPAHLTFPMKLSSKIQCRLSIDVHFSEWINVNIDTICAQVMLYKSRPEFLFNFTLRAITRSEKDQQESPPSYPEKQIMPHEGKQRKSNTQDQNKLIWINKQTIKLPKIQRKVNSSELPHCSIQFMLWECNNVEIQQDDVLAGQCYISMLKAAASEPVEGMKYNRSTLLYKISINDKLWLNGKCVGTAKIDLVLQIEQYIKQNLLLVRTQQGLQMSTPVFDTTKQRVECPEIIEIQKLQNSIQSSLAKIQGLKRSETLKVQDTKSKILASMSKLLTLLQSTKKESIKFYIYKSEKDLLNGQQILLDVGINMLLRLNQEQNLIFKQYCWKTLIAIIQRGQLSLRYTGFSIQQRNLLKQGQKDKFLEQKIQFSLKYQQFLYDALATALKSMQSKNLETLQRRFVEFYCAFSYLRVPEFRQQLLTAITRKNDPIIEEWRGIQFSLQNQKQGHRQRTNDPNLSLIYNWDQHFYMLISHDPRSIQNIQNLRETLSINGWRQRMSKRGVAFFLFLTYWIQYIKIAAIISQNLVWHVLPGYNKLVKAILSELNLRKITQYPDSLKQVSTKMLTNQKLLNIFVIIVLKKMNLMQYNSVVSGLDMISNFFKYISSTGRQIPTTFNYSNFLSSLKNIITHQHSFSAAACLKLIYDHYSIFAPQFRREISSFLLGKIFFRLFLSWSFNIRVVFHHLLLFRLVFLSNKLPMQKRALQHGINSQVKRRYLILMNILENIKLRKQEDQCDNFRINYQKQYFKKMRKKLQEGRKMTTTQNNLIDRHVKRKNTIKQNKYSIKQLSRPTETLRSHSQLIQNVHVNYNIKASNQHEPHSHFDYSQDSSQTEQHLKIRKKIQPQYQISQLPMQLLQYTKQALTQFRDIEQKFDKFYSGNFNNNVVPQLNIKIPTDEGEFRTLVKEDW